jgi:hypothetical protein
MRQRMVRPITNQDKLGRRIELGLWLWKKTVVWAARMPVAVVSIRTPCTDPIAGDGHTHLAEKDL